VWIVRELQPESLSSTGQYTFDQLLDQHDDHYSILGSPTRNIFTKRRFFVVLALDLTRKQ